MKKKIDDKIVETKIIKLVSSYLIIRRQNDETNLAQ